MNTMLKDAYQELTGAGIPVLVDRPGLYYTDAHYDDCLVFHSGRVESRPWVWVGQMTAESDRVSEDECDEDGYTEMYAIACSKYPTLAASSNAGEDVHQGADRLSLGELVTRCKRAYNG
jgi:hypothetical protein